MPKTATRLPADEAQFTENGDRQPYYKLHGSPNLLGGADGRLLIIGGNKAVQIGQYPLLTWCHQQFRAYLARAQRLMIVGYGFNDDHINQALIEAATNGAIRIFIVDPLGIDVLNEQEPPRYSKTFRAYERSRTEDNWCIPPPVLVNIFRWPG